MFIDFDSAANFTRLVEYNFQIGHADSFTGRWQQLYIKSLPEPRVEGPAEEPVEEPTPSSV